MVNKLGVQMSCLCYDKSKFENLIIFQNRKIFHRRLTQYIESDIITLINFLGEINGKDIAYSLKHITV